MYNLGKGIPIDNNKAKKWFTLSSEQGLGTAFFHLGLMYSLGDLG